MGKVFQTDKCKKKKKYKNTKNKTHQKNLFSLSNRASTLFSTTTESIMFNTTDSLRIYYGQLVENILFSSWSSLHNDCICMQSS